RPRRRWSRFPACAPTAAAAEQIMSASTVQAAAPAAPRPLDAAAIAIILVLSFSWGFNQVAVKLALHDIPPLTQSAIRSCGAALIVAAWMRACGLSFDLRDGTLVPGIVAGALFGPRVFVDLSRLGMDRGVARGPVHLHGAVLRRARRALVLAGRTPGSV